MNRWLSIIALITVCASPVQAQDVSGTTLQRIADKGIFTIGYVPDAAPMSFDAPDGKVSGYSVELCRHIGAAVKRRLGRDDLEIQYVPLIAPQERINGVVEGKVDIECGATTVTLSRREQVDFTLMTFITGGTVLSRRTKPIPTLEDLPGNTVAVIKGTTTQAALREFGVANDYDFRLRLIETHDEGMRLLNAGEVDGYASDRVMLLGQVFRATNARDYQLASSVFSFEPYSLMLTRGDTEFRLLADSALAALYRDARIRRMYHNWFGRYGEPLSPIVEAMYEFQAVSN